jgi:hypothetical protein
MQSVSTLAHSNAMAPEEQRDLTETSGTSGGVRPTGMPTTCTAILNAVVRDVEVMVDGSWC